MRIKLFAISGVALALLVETPSLAQVMTGCYPITTDDTKALNPPRFESYPATSAMSGKPAPADLSSNPKARRFRTELRDGAASGPDFAGHYTIVGWGCGTACLDFAIVDAKTGRVFFPSDVATVSVANVGTAKGEPDPNFDALRYRLDSNLLIVIGAPKEDTRRDGIAYYRWDGAALKPLRFFRSRKHQCDG